MLCSSPIISEILPEIYTMTKFDFLLSVIHYLITLFCVLCVQVSMKIFLGLICITTFS